MVRADGGRLIPLGDDSYIKFPDELGSEFFVARDKIAMNIHVAAGATKIRAKLVSIGKSYEIESVTTFDAKNDLAILQIVGKGPKPIPLGNSDAVQIDE